MRQKHPGEQVGDLTEDVARLPLKRAKIIRDLFIKKTKHYSIPNNEINTLLHNKINGKDKTI